MKAIRKERAEAGLVMREICEPMCHPGEVKIKILLSSFCPTDLMIDKWTEWAAKNVTLPVTIGHEFVGEIVEVGEQVNGFVIGEIVSAEDRIPCFGCNTCKSGFSHLCPTQRHLGCNFDGCCAQYLVIPANLIVSIPQGFPLEVASFMSFWGVPVHAVTRSSIKGKRVLIAGMGIMGMLAATTAGFYEPNYLLYLTTNRNDCKKLDGMQTLIADEANRGELNSVLKPNSFDTVISLGGGFLTFNKAVEILKEKGEINLLSFGDSCDPEWRTFSTKGIQMNGISGRRIFQDWENMLELVKKGIDIKKFITHVLPYTDYERALKIVWDDPCAKVLLDWRI